jgi:hypothetical protein
MSADPMKQGFCNSIQDLRNTKVENEFQGDSKGLPNAGADINSHRKENGEGG